MKNLLERIPEKPRYILLTILHVVFAIVFYWCTSKTLQGRIVNGTCIFINVCYIALCISKLVEFKKKGKISGEKNYHPTDPALIKSEAFLGWLEKRKKSYRNEKVYVLRMEDYDVSVVEETFKRKARILQTHNGYLVTVKRAGWNTDEKYTCPNLIEALKLVDDWFDFNIEPDVIMQFTPADPMLRESGLIPNNVVRTNLAYVDVLEENLKWLQIQLGYSLYNHCEYCDFRLTKKNSQEISVKVRLNIEIGVLTISFYPEHGEEQVVTSLEWKENKIDSKTFRLWITNWINDGTPPEIPAHGNLVFSANDLGIDTGKIPPPQDLVWAPGCSQF